uniref:ABC transporter ATP-binding protein n=1 Tax=Castellaniella defragrans TaxID=75697 RepID=UPI003342BBAF
MTDLVLQGLNVTVAGKEVCKNVGLKIPEGELHVLLGPNASGKSSLISAVMGLPDYQVTKGSIEFNGRELSGMPIDERARFGIGMSFQRPPVIRGVTIEMFAESIGQSDRLKEYAHRFLFGDFSERILNEGFSGGEIKRWEVLRLFLQKPDLCLFDEPESGVDYALIAKIGGLINELMQEPTASGKRRSGLLITHAGFILDHVQARQAHMIVDGAIVCSAEPRAMLQHIKAHGYVAI